jgi:hypothetical protein
VVETGAARQSEAWPRIKRTAAGVFALGFVVAFTTWLTAQTQAQPRYAATSHLTDPLLPPGVVVIVVAATFVGVGVLLLLEPGQRANGGLLVAVGVLYAVSGLNPRERSALAAVVIDFSRVLPWVCLGWLLLRYPEERLARWYERVFVVVSAVWLIGWQSLVTITWPPWWGGRPADRGLALVATEL